jgi:hypothetical protein
MKQVFQGFANQGLLIDDQCRARRREHAVWGCLGRWAHEGFIGRQRHNLSSA